ncbi:hypothetical protein A2U01_0112077, partial [Trifolium medium]|nr:hypothetical protein [Trifolium medium]
RVKLWHDRGKLSRSNPSICYVYHGRVRLWHGRDRSSDP